jgi:PKHD-type hydroxylase
MNSQIRKLSLTIQLSDPFSYNGGELHLFTGNEPTIIPKEQGKLISFPSYVLHEVTPVTKGERYSLVAWITGPQFK